MKYMEKYLVANVGATNHFYSNLFNSSHESHSFMLKVSLRRLIMIVVVGKSNFANLVVIYSVI